MDGSPPGSAVPGILQARTLEWVAISFSNARNWKVKVKSLSCVRLLATPGTAAYQAPPSMGLSRQEYWSGVPMAKEISRWSFFPWDVDLQCTSVHLGSLCLLPSCPLTLTKKQVIFWHGGAGKRHPDGGLEDHIFKCAPWQEYWM